MEYLLIGLTGILATTAGTLAGGGGFISLPVMMLLGIPVQSAVGANKVANTISSFSSFLYLYRNKKISFKEVYWIVPVSLAGGVTGGVIASRMNEEYMEAAAIVLLLFAFAASFFKQGQFSGEGEIRFNKFSFPGLYAIGIYDGMIGPGQGTFMLYLFGALKVSYIRAVAGVRLATFSSCFGAAVTYIAAGQMIWPLTLCLLAGSLAGAQIGVRLAEKLKARTVLVILRLVTLGLIIQLIGENLLEFAGGFR